MESILEGKKVLHLTLKKKWFDMIASGEKKEEYRELKDYWKKRLVHPGDIGGHIFKQFDTVCFHHGYATDAPIIILEFLGIEKKEGNQEWGADAGVKYFVIKLGKIIHKSNGTTLNPKQITSKCI